MIETKFHIFDCYKRDEIYLIKKLQNLSINSAHLYEKAQGKNFNV